ncbi:hypothetical protein EIN_391630 [Entamoeba invadens IP1]|uniref:Phosphatidic acid phosphatase type 2/haloperoxidase domain-containing protein n=1 Tax=Entamoeba invadens IP1 TaxID=370355 RepID=A0A0A1U8T9_ENTIV|nr:hypothetical protein EIN_391630 [Entamoeba invadens IP1]ELP89508.1 hypothetical protein EIN_391630 [Entamoeba invadens IP1]|eukprot:XP_004256279.1 hypothetical protein EIN_391630 [Entamoeba invadens IP1]
METAHRTGFSTIMNPTYFALASAFGVFVVSLIQKIHHKIIVMVYPFTLIINAFVFYKSLYLLIVIAKVYMNDTLCSKNGNKYNGISGHYFTYVFLYVVLFHLLNTIQYTIKSPLKTVCWECIEYPLPLKNALLTWSSVIQFQPSFQMTLALLLTFSYSVFAWGSLTDTIVIGYHTPQQTLLGLIFAILAVLLYLLFVEIPFVFQALLNFVSLTILTLALSFVKNQNAADYTVVVAVVAVVLSVINKQCDKMENR